MLRFDGIFIFTLVFGSLRAECPGLEDIKDMQNDQTFTCARFYYGWGHDLGVRGCNGCSISEYADIPHGMDLGGFQLLNLFIRELKSHITC